MKSKYLQKSDSLSETDNNPNNLREPFLETMIPVESKPSNNQMPNLSTIKSHNKSGSRNSSWLKQSRISQEHPISRTRTNKSTIFNPNFISIESSNA